LDKRSDIQKLIEEAKNGSQRAFSELALRYKPLMESECLRRNDGRVDLDDLKQAALIGLYSAVCCFDPSRGVTFGAYARVCIGNRVKSELRSAPAESEPYDEESDHDFVSSSPEEDFIARETLARKMSDVEAALSDYEKQVFRLYLSGESYKFIAARLGRSEKSVDGAVARSKEKLRRVFASE